MYSKFITLLVVAAISSACAGDKSVKVASLQKKDKNLSCSEVQLEINEAEFYRKTAENNKNPDIKSLLMPLGYISTYVNADEASKAAEARVNYLNRIYDILDCDNPASVGNARQAGAAPQLYGGFRQQRSQVQYAPVQHNSGQTYYNYNRTNAPIDDEWYY